MKRWKRWGVCIYGVSSGAKTLVTFYRFWRKENAIKATRRLNAQLPTYSHGDGIVRYCVYDYREEAVHVEE